MLSLNNHQIINNYTLSTELCNVGKTGKATGAHLHYEVIVDGEYVDPIAYIK